MARTINFDFRRGGGSSIELMYGKVTLQPTMIHSVGTSAVIPAPTTWDLVAGKASALNVAPSPAPIDGKVAWAYKVTVEDRHCRKFEYLVGVPDGVPPINFVDLPTYYETQPPAFGVGPAGPAGASATVAVGTTTSGPAPSVNNSGTSTNAIFDFVLQQGPVGPTGPGVPSGGDALQYIRRNIGNTTTEWATLDKTAVGLPNVDDTSDVDKPVSTAQGTAISAAITESQAGEDVRVSTLLDTPGTNMRIAADAAIDASRRTAFFMVTDYGAKGDGVTDDTAAFQAAVDAAMAITLPGNIASGGISVIIPHSVNTYRIDQLNIRAAGATYITLEGWGSAVIQPIGAEDGRPVFVVGGLTAANSNRNLRLANFRVFGTGYWNSTAQVDRLAFSFPRMGTSIMDNIFIAGFKQGAIDGYDLWDNRFRDVRILTCGHSTSPVDFAYAVAKRGIQDHSNANEWYGVHIEHCALALFFDGGSRWNHFIGGKIEFSDRMAHNSGKPPILFQNSTENTFLGTMFTENRYSTQAMIWGRASDTGLQTINNVRRRHQFIGCQWYGGIGAGGAVVPFDGSDADFVNCIFQRVNGDSGAMPFTFLNRVKMNGCTVTFQGEGIRLFSFNGNDNTVEGLTAERGPGVGASNGSYLFLGGSVSGNLIDGFKRLGPQSGTSLISTSQTDLGSNVIKDSQVPTKLVTSGSTPSVLLAHVVHLTYSVATDITGFLHGHESQRIVIRPSNGNVTLVNSAAMQVKGGTRTLTAGEVVELLNDTGVWREL